MGHLGIPLGPGSALTSSCVSVGPWDLVLLGISWGVLVGTSRGVLVRTSCCAFVVTLWGALVGPFLRLYKQKPTGSAVAPAPGSGSGREYFLPHFHLRAAVPGAVVLCLERVPGGHSDASSDSVVELRGPSAADTASWRLVLSAAISCFDGTFADIDMQQQ